MINQLSILLKKEKASSNVIYFSMNERKIKNSFFRIGIILFSLVTISMVFMIVGTLLYKGYHQINWAFFTQVAPDTFTAMMAKSSGQSIPGGIVNGITGSVYLVLIASLIAIPLGVLIGVFLYENGQKKVCRDNKRYS